MNYSAKLLEHFEQPRYVGELQEPAVCVEVVNSACGDCIRLWVLVKDGVIIAASMKAVGCPPTIASASALCEMVRGMEVAKACLLDVGSIEQALGGLPRGKRHAAILAIEALEEALRRERYV